MVTLKDNTLSFIFDGLTSKVRGLVEAYIAEIMPRLQSESREPALDQLRARWRYKQANRTQQLEAERQILEATPSAIEKALRRLSLKAAQVSNLRPLAAVHMQFQRTLRIPDDGKIYPLPAGLGRFPLRDIDQFGDSVDPAWLERGGVLMPMYQSEALWIYFRTDYPFAVKVGAGKINAVTGETWADGLQPSPQNYLVLPEQPWLDGFAVGKGIIRQFVAMPLGEGYSVEEQLTGRADVGGLQLQIYPMNAGAYFRSIAARLPKTMEDLVDELVTIDFDRHVLFAQKMRSCDASYGAAMGLGAGGTMRQEIYEDRHDFGDWDQSASSRCFVHLCNSTAWRRITGSNPPHPPFTNKEYTAKGIPWFDYYRDDLEAVPGSAVLDGASSVLAMGQTKGEQPLPDNSTLEPTLTIQYGNTRRPDEVRQWAEQ